MTEQEAINRIEAGDADAFSVLYDLYLDRVYRFVYYRTHHKQTTEDLVSVIFTKAFSKFESFDRHANFATWLFRIARNTVIDHYRTSKSTTDIEDAFNLTDSTNLTRDFELREKLDQAIKYLSSLPSEQKDLVMMRLWDELSYKEIAEITGKSEANLRVSFSRVISKMQTEMVSLIILFAILIK